MKAVVVNELLWGLLRESKLGQANTWGSDLAKTRAPR